MIKRAYLSTIHPAWSLDRQREAIGPCDAEYVDEFGVPARKRGNPTVLKSRAELLRPTSRKTVELIVVASPVCLAFNARDFGAALAAAALRNATILFVDSGLEIPPRPETALVDQAVQAFTVAHNRRGLHRTHEEVAQDRRKDTEKRIEIIRPFWHLKEPPTPVLLAMAGVKPGKPMAPATAKDHLGSRPKVQAKHKIEVDREAGRAAARARKKLLKEVTP